MSRKKTIAETPPPISPIESSYLAELKYMWFASDISVDHLRSREVGLLVLKFGHIEGTHRAVISIDERSAKWLSDQILERLKK